MSIKPSLKTEAVNLRTDNTMAIGKKGQIYKTLHRKLQLEQLKPH